MVSTKEGVTDDSPNVPMTSTTVKKPNDRKSLCLFINIFDVKNKIAERLIGAAKLKCRDMQVGNSLWNKKKKKRAFKNK